MATSKKGILNKLYPIAVLFLVFAVFVVYKVVDIKFLSGDVYKNEAKVNTIKVFDVPASRGNIYSAKGNLLATNVARYNIRMDLLTISKENFNDSIKYLSNAIADYFSKSRSSVEARLKKARKNKNRYLLIARDVSYNQYLQIKKFPLFIQGPYRGGIIAEKKLLRERPNKKIAERTIGWDEFRIDSNGDKYKVRVGLEGFFTDILRGKAGKILKQKIAKGQWKPIFDSQQIEPIDGKDIVTTLDLNIQDIAHHALLEQLKKFKAEHGTVIIMETKTGQIKAISNLGRTANGNYYEKLNYAVGESHEPGSTFKTASLMVALEDKKIDTGYIIDTENGTKKYYNRVVRDSHHGGYGKISAARALEVSSNVGLAKIIVNNYKNNPTAFINGLEKLGLNQKLNIPIKGEGNPYIPNPKNKKTWYGTTLPWMSFGYGVSFTPLQMLTFYNAIANNGKMVKPMFVKEIKDHNKILKKFNTEVIKEKICSSQTINKITEMLKNVVKRGTATNIYNKNYHIAGKTGTCQAGYNKSKKTEYIASFAGFFPAEKPTYSCIVVIHKPDTSIGYYGRAVAAPVFEKIAKKLYTDNPVKFEINKPNSNLLAVDSNYKNYQTQINKEYKVIPNVKGMQGMDAVSLLENLGIKVTFDGTGKVIEQSLPKGEKIKHGTTIYLKLS